MKINIEVVRVEVAYMRDGEMYRESEVFQKPRRLTSAKLMEVVRAKYGAQSMVARSDLKTVVLEVPDNVVITALNQATEQ